MRPAPPLSSAAACSLASWQVAQATALAERPAPGLWAWLEQFGMIDSFVALLPVLAAGAVVATLVQPTLHVRGARPWSDAITLAMVISTLLLPVSIAFCVAIVPVALCTTSARRIIAWLIVGMAVPLLGPMAFAVVIWRLSLALRLPPHANDNVPPIVRA